MSSAACIPSGSFFAALVLGYAQIVGALACARLEDVGIRRAHVLPSRHGPPCAGHPLIG